MVSKEKRPQYGEHAWLWPTDTVVKTRYSYSPQFGIPKNHEQLKIRGEHVEAGILFYRHVVLGLDWMLPYLEWVRITHTYNGDTRILSMNCEVKIVEPVWKDEFKREYLIALMQGKNASEYPFTAFTSARTLEERVKDGATELCREVISILEQSQHRREAAAKELSEWSAVVRDRDRIFPHIDHGSRNKK